MNSRCLRTGIATLRENRPSGHIQRMVVEMSVYSCVAIVVAGSGRRKVGRIGGESMPENTCRERRSCAARAFARQHEASKQGKEL